MASRARQSPSSTSWFATTRLLRFYESSDFESDRGGAQRAVAAIADGRETSTMCRGRVCTVMAFVADPGAAARFWSAALDAPLHPDLPAVNAGDVLLFFHAADPARNPQGGTVAYFEVARLDELRDALLLAGCVAHRGPLKLADGRWVCQIRDPFGTIWGLEGARRLTPLVLPRFVLSGTAGRCPICLIASGASVLS